MPIRKIKERNEGRDRFKNNRIQYVERDLDYLCGHEAYGRLSGTVGAKKAAEYIKSTLESAGITPLGSNGYFDPVEVRAARLVGPVKLKVGNIELKHRHDFDEFTAFSGGGIAEGKLLIVTDGEIVNESELPGSIVLIPNRPADFDLAATIETAKQWGVRALIIESGEPDWFYKTVYGSSDNKIIVLRIRRSVAEKLVSFSGEMVYIELPLESGLRLCSNIIGFLRGERATDTLALTAHYDHVGSDPGGEHFPGAFDNASGVAVLLELARELAEIRHKLPYNILFVFLTGEESGLWGSKHFAANLPVPLKGVINIDSVGIEDKLNAIRIGQKKPLNNFVRLAANVFKRHGVLVQWITGSDDSMIFINKGIPTLGLGQQPITKAPNHIHKPSDTFEAVNLKVIDEMVEIIYEILLCSSSKFAAIGSFMRNIALRLY